MDCGGAPSGNNGGDWQSVGSISGITNGGNGADKPGGDGGGGGGGGGGAEEDLVGAGTDPTPTSPPGGGGGDCFTPIYNDYSCVNAIDLLTQNDLL